MQKTIAGTIISPATRFPERIVSESLDGICMKALSTDPAGRYVSVEGLQGDVQAYLGGFITSAENAGFGKQLVKLIARHKAISVTAGVSLSILIMATAWFVRTLSISEKSAVRAEFMAKKNEEKAVAHYETLKASLHRETALKLERSQLLYTHAWARCRATCDSYTPEIDAELLTLLDTVLAGDPHLNGAWRLKGLILLVRQDFAGAERCFQTSGSKYADFKDLAAKYRAATADRPLDTAHLLELVEELTAMSHLYHNHRMIAAVLAQDPENHAFRLGAIKAINPGQEDWHVGIDHAARSLDLSDNHLLVDLFPLAGSDITRLNLSHAAKLNRIRPYLSSLPLAHLDLSHTRVSRVQGFEHKPLTTLHLRHSQLASLDFVKGMNIEELSITNIPCTDLDPVTTLMGLKTLHCSKRQADILARKMDFSGIKLVIETDP
ncbi:MAG: hypothetical protein ACI8W8_004084 [Rhodothermales bacterium]|jgi:hypothetical protein